MRRIEIVLFLLLWATFAYFHHQKPGWNVNSRLGLTAALVDLHTVRIDRFYKTQDMGTEDAASFGGHIYSDKVIGTSLLGLPAYQLARWTESLTGATYTVGTRRYWVTVFSAGILAALSGVLLLRLLMIVGNETDPRGPLVITLLTFLGTQLFFHATLFMPYTPAIFFLLWAIVRFEQWRARQNGSPPLFSCGLFLGLAMMCELTVGMAAMLWGLYMMASIPRKLDAWKTVLGAVLGLSPFVIYSFAIFGKPAIPYQYELTPMFREYMARGFMGATSPKLGVLAWITVLPYRGLFIHSPFLILAPVGLLFMFQRPESRKLALYILAACAWYFLFNSAYFMWWGGWSFGPRHLAFTIPLLAIPLIYVWQHAAGRIAMLCLGAIGLGIHLVVNTVDPQTPDVNRATPMATLLKADLRTHLQWLFPVKVWPDFLSGNIDANWGTMLGLRGPASLIPLLVLWAALGTLIWKSLPNKTAPAPHKADTPRRSTRRKKP